MKRYYWLKLKDDIFQSKRIKKLRRLAGGDTLLIIYLEMQLKAMKDDGFIRYTGLEESFADEIALDLDEDPDNVSMALAYLTKCGLVELVDNNTLFVPYAIENVGSETAAAQRKREQRAREKCDIVTLMSQNCHGETETDIEIEKEIEKEIDKRQTNRAEEMLDGLSNEDNSFLSSIYEDYEELLLEVGSIVANRDAQTPIRKPRAYIMKIAEELNWERKT